MTAINSLQKIIFIRYIDSLLDSKSDYDKHFICDVVKDFVVFIRDEFHYLTTKSVEFSLDPVSEEEMLMFLKRKKLYKFRVHKIISKIQKKFKCLKEEYAFYAPDIRNVTLCSISIIKKNYEIYNENQKAIDKYSSLMKDMYWLQMFA